MTPMVLFLTETSPSIGDVLFVFLSQVPVLLLFFISLFLLFNGSDVPLDDRKD